MTENPTRRFLERGLFPSVLRRGFLPSLLVAAAFFAMKPALLGCPYSIRDSAFIGRGSVTPFQLLFPVESASIDVAKLETFRSDIEKSAAAWLEKTNVVAKIIDLSKDEDRSHPPEVRAALRKKSRPAAVLVAAGDASYALTLPRADEASSSALLSKEALSTLFKSVIQSPVRTGLHDSLIDRWCVALFVPGSSPDANAAAKKATEAAAKKIVGKKTELGKIIEIGPSVVPVAHDAAEESVLRWSLRLDTNAENAENGENAENTKREPRVVLLAGRGETRGPTLTGREITEDGVLGLLEMLGRSCSCTTSTTWLIGTAIPFTWTDEHALAARTKLGFDPLDPAVLKSIRGEKKGPDELVGLGAFEELAYEEIEIEGEGEGEGEGGSPPPELADRPVPDISIYDRPAEELPTLVTVPKTPKSESNTEAETRKVESEDSPSSVRGAIATTVVILFLLTIIATTLVRRPQRT